MSPTTVVSSNVMSPSYNGTCAGVGVHCYWERAFARPWAIDPRTRKAWRCTMGGIAEVGELRTEDPEIVVPLAALFDRD
jgi:hypothetical protein